MSNTTSRQFDQRRLYLEIVAILVLLFITGAVCCISSPLSFADTPSANAQIDAAAVSDNQRIDTADSATVVSPASDPAGANGSAVTKLAGSDHVQDVGTTQKAAVGQGTALELGSTGQAKRLEGFSLETVDAPAAGASVEYSAHVQDVGWQESVKDGSLAGTQGEAKRVEAVKIELTGDLANALDVWYRAHVQNIGWMGWVRNGVVAGTTGRGLRLEALQVELLSKGKVPEGYQLGNVKIVAESHVENIGWSGSQLDPEVIGTTNQGLRLEALTLSLGGAVPSGLGVAYQAHVQDYGWMDWVADGKTAGTAGQSKRIEAFRIQLTGINAADYDVWYCLHVANIGWMGWAKNGAKAGTSGSGIRVEAIKVRLVATGSFVPPTTSVPAYIDSYSAKLECGSLSSGNGDWQIVGVNEIAGTTGQGRPLLGIKLTNKSSFAGSIVYSTHLSNIGWTSKLQDGAISGTGSADNRVEAMTLEITGDLAKYYDIYYRTHVAGYGWIGWAKNGEAAGSSGLTCSMEAYEVVLVVRGGTAPGGTNGHFIKKLSKDGLIASLNSASSSGGLTSFGNMAYDFGSANGQWLQSAVNAFYDSGNRIGFMMMDLITGDGVACSADDVYYSASTIKGPYVAAINKYDPGSIDGTIAEWMDEAITVSDNDAYGALRDTYGGGIMSAEMESCGVSSFDPDRNYVYYTPRDLAKLWVGNYDYFFENTNFNSEWCRNLYTTGNVGAHAIIHNALADSYTVYAKPGWFPGGGYDVQNDAGIVMAGSRPYVISILSSACDEFGMLGNLVNALNAVHDDIA